MWRWECNKNGQSTKPPRIVYMARNENYFAAILKALAMIASPNLNT